MKLTRQSKLLSLAALIILSASLLCGSWVYQNVHGNDSMDGVENHEMILSAEKKTFDTYVEISIQAENYLTKDFAIKYVINGSIYDEDLVQEYSGPIRIEKTNIAQVVPVEAVALCSGEVVYVLKTTIFVDSLDYGLYGRYNSYIFSVTVDRDDLYDEKSGILVEGKNYDGTFYSANFAQRGEEWRRDAHLEIYDNSFNLLVSQDVKVGVQGKGSSLYDLKPLKFSALEENNEKIHLDFNEYDFERYSPYQSVSKYNQLLVSNGGNDFISRMNLIRYSILKEFAKEAGFMVAQTSLASVYLNGEYYGLMELREDFTPSLIANKTGSDAEFIEILGENELDCAKQAGYYDLLFSDLNDPLNRKKLEQIIDIDQFLLYYAFEMLCNNVDWPANNYRIYKDTSIIGDKYKPILFDLDHTFGMDLGFAPEVNGESILDNLMSEDTFFIKQILQYEGYKDQLINYFSDLLNKTFYTENIQSIFQKYHDSIYTEMKYTAQESNIEWVRFLAENYSGNYFWFQTEVETRIQQFPSLLDQYFNANELGTFILDITAPDSGNTIVWNSNLLFSGQDYSGVYYTASPFYISASIAPGQAFDYWVINGENVYSESFSVADYIEDGKLSVALVTKQENDEYVRISGISNAQNNDFIEITNYGLQPVEIGKYSLSEDDTETLHSLPDVLLQPEETVKLYCKNSASLFGYLVNFNLSLGEELLLLNEKEDVVDSIKIIETGGNSSMYLSRYQGSLYFSQAEIE